MPIDFVILWVDGNDPEWLKDFQKWQNICEGDKSKKRFRDWDNLQYLFRGVEKFTPWVRKIHFVTWGHVPQWLKEDHPKLNVVRHSEFLKKNNLPIFNSRAIEINLHRIKELSDRFVYFNDDMFILKPLNETRFFRQGLPCDMLVFTNVLLTHLAHVRVNDLLLINKHFDKISVLRKDFLKWFNLKYRSQVFKSLALLPWPQITGIVDPHQPQPFLKSTFSELWEVEEEILQQTSGSKFKNDTDVNQYLFRYWQLLKGEFVPVGFHDSDCIQIENIEMAEKVSQSIVGEKQSLLCINDLLDNNDERLFETVKSIVNSSFKRLLPEKSGFEK